MVAYAGTNDSIDLRTDFQLAVNGASNQDYRALQFAREAEDKLLSMGVADYKIVYSGHSLGGYLAQIAAILNDNAKAVVFNSPGIWGCVGSRS